MTSHLPPFYAHRAALLLHRASNEIAGMVAAGRGGQVGTAITKCFSVLLFAAFLVYESRIEDPMLRLELFKGRNDRWADLLYWEV